MISAAPLAHPDDLVRQGNVAFAREEYDRAVKLYEQAEERITDPGLLAFNKGAALYRAGRYRAAELHFRRALEGADGLRRVRARYDLGNCLLQQAGNNDAKGLEEAISCYDACVADVSAAPDLKAWAEHNLELARLLWHEARKAAREGPSPNDQENGNDSASTEPREQRTQRGDPGMQEARPDPRGQAGAQAQADGKQKPTETPQQTPGKGNLPALPDRDELVPLSPEDAVAYLELAATRIQRERREYRQSGVSSRPQVKDW
jgi:tetratricopeptide (TPR) repeat protein